MRKVKLECLQQCVIECVDPLFSSHGYQRQNPSQWAKKLPSMIHMCSLGVHKTDSGQFWELIGGASIFLPEIHPLFQPDYKDFLGAKLPSTIGGPIHFIDKRLHFNSGRLRSENDLKKLLPVFRRAFEECALPELERYMTQEALLISLLDEDWVNRVLLAPSAQRRGAVVILLLAKYRGVSAARNWAREELERMRLDDDRPVRWKEMQVALEVLDN